MNRAKINLTLKSFGFIVYLKEKIKRPKASQYERMMKMAIMTGEQYLESMRKLKLNIYMFGEKIENSESSPILRPSLNSVKATYDLACDPQYEDIMTATFPSDRGKNKPFHPHPPEHGRPYKKGQDAETLRKQDSFLFPEMRRP